MASKVQIANMALVKLGVNPIVSFSDNTDAGKKINLVYDDIVDEVISEGAWASATTRATLARTTNTPEYEYTYEFQLPTNPQVLRVLQINETLPGEYDYRIEGDKLLANTSSIKIKYIGTLSDSQDYGPYLKKAIEFRLAAELAYPLTGDRGLADRLMQRYFQVRSEGLAFDGTQGSSDMSNSSDLTDVR